MFDKTLDFTLFLQLPSQSKSVTVSPYCIIFAILYIVIFICSHCDILPVMPSKCLFVNALKMWPYASTSLSMTSSHACRTDKSSLYLCTVMITFPVFPFIFFSPQLKRWEEPSSSALGTQSAIWPPNQTEMFSCKTFTLLRVSFSQGTVLTYMSQASHSTDVMCGCHLLTIQTLRYNGPVPNVNISVVFWYKLV